MTSPHEPELESILFPRGTTFNDRELSLLMEEYKLIVETSEKLVARRQTVNTFFLSVNAVLLSAAGVVIAEVTTKSPAGWGLIAIGLAGILLSITWRKLVHSYRQLNAGKFEVIHLLEQYIPAALFKAEWTALGEGRDKKKYTPFTKTESLIPIVFILLYVASIVGGIVYLLTSI